jgi:hypothetical protein
MESDNQSECEAQRSRGITLEVLLNATKLSVGKHEQLSHYLKRVTHLALNGDASKALSKRGAAIRKIENLHHCPHLKVLYLYDNEIEAVENLDAVPQLTHLHLQGNCLRRIENLEPLKLLEKLYLEKARRAGGVVPTAGAVLGQPECADRPTLLVRRGDNAGLGGMVVL